MKQECIHALLDVTVIDEVRFQEYLKGHMPSLEQYGGKVIFRSTNLKVVEGNWSPKIFVIQAWPSIDDFNKWYNSEEYKPWKEMRELACKINFVITGL